MDMQPGTKVTKQPRTWYDGTPIVGWPDAKYIGTVCPQRHAFEPNDDGLQMILVKVKWATGRTEWENVTDLTVVS